MTLKTILAFMLGLVCIFAVYLFYDNRQTGGYAFGTDSYNGFQFPADNGFSKVEDCQRAITDFPGEKPPSKEWMEGCKHYFEVHN